jgi:hypothetical protein
VIGPNGFFRMLASSFLAFQGASVLKNPLRPFGAFYYARSRRDSCPTGSKRPSVFLSQIENQPKGEGEGPKQSLALLPPGGHGIKYEFFHCIS